MPDRRGYEYPPTRPPAGGLPESELERLGRRVRLEPGKRTRLSVAWRLAPGGKSAVRIEYSGGWLPSPRPDPQPARIGSPR